MTDDHISFDELAELDEDLLTPQRAAEVQAHLAECAECRARAQAIASTRQQLGALPPVQMPEAVQARLDQALRDAGTPSHDVVPDLSSYRRRRWNRPTLAGSAAAAVIVAVLVAIVVGHLGSATSSGGGSGATSAAGLPSTPPVAQPKNYQRSSTGQTYTPLTLLTRIPALVERVPAAFGASGKTSTVPGPEASGAAPTATPTLPQSQGIEHGPVPAALRPLFDSRTKILQCAAVLTGQSDAVPIAVDFGRWTNAAYKNAPSAIFVMRDADPNWVDVYVTDPTCSGTGQVEIYDRVPLN